MRVFLRNATVSALVMAATLSAASAEEIWFATHNLLPGDVLRDGDLEARTPARPVGAGVPVDRVLTGLEIRRRVYANHPIDTRDTGPVTVIKANTPVEVRWETGTLSLTMQGRALEPGAIGDEIRVLNPLTSQTVRGTVQEDGTVEVRGIP